MISMSHHRSDFAKFPILTLDTPLTFPLKKIFKIYGFFPKILNQPKFLPWAQKGALILGLSKNLFFSKKPFIKDKKNKNHFLGKWAPLSLRFPKPLLLFSSFLLASPVPFLPSSPGPPFPGAPQPRALFPRPPSFPSPKRGPRPVRLEGAPFFPICQRQHILPGFHWTTFALPYHLFKGFFYEGFPPWRLSHPRRCGGPSPKREPSVWPLASDNNLTIPPSYSRRCTYPSPSPKLSPSHLSPKTFSRPGSLLHRPRRAPSTSLPPWAHSFVPMLPTT